MKSGFYKKLAITALSIALFPLAAEAADVNKSVRIGNIGEGADAHVDIFTTGEGLTAIPYIKINKSPEEIARDAERKVNTGNLPGDIVNDGKAGEKLDPAGGEISLSNATRFLKEAKENLKNSFRRDTRQGKTAGATDAKLDRAGDARRDAADIVVCENCANRAQDALTRIQ